MLVKFSRLFICLCVASALGVYGIDPAKWKILHEKMLKKAAAEKAVKDPLTRHANVEDSSMGSKLGDTSTSGAALIETIPIRLEYNDEVIDVEFKLMDSPDPSAQARLFCNQYDLSEVYCEALTARAVDVFSSAMPSKSDPAAAHPVSEPPASSAASMSDSSSSSVASKLRDILNKRRQTLSSATTPAATAASSSTTSKSKITPTATDPSSSVAPKLADILSKRRKPAAPNVPPLPATATTTDVVGNIIDIIPIRMEYDDEIVDIEFEVYDNVDPSRQAKSFCLKHDLVDEYCEALTARAESIYSRT